MGTGVTTGLEGRGGLAGGHRAIWALLGETTGGEKDTEWKGDVMIRVWGGWR